MKVLVVTHSYPRWKNDLAANFVEDLCAAYCKAGCEVTLLIPNIDGWKRKEADLGGVRVIRYNYFFFKRWQRFGYGSALTDDRKLSPFHIFLSPFLILSGTYRLKKLLRAEPDFDFIHAHWAVPNSIIAVLGRRKSKMSIPVFTSFPGSDVTALTVLKEAGTAIAKKIIARSDYLSCNSSDLRDALVEVGLERDKIDLVIYGVDSNKNIFNAGGRERVRNSLGILSDEKMLLMVGRFVSKKGFDTGLKAMKKIISKFPHVKMVIAGSGELKPEYERIIEEEGIKNHVIFPGIIALEELPDYYSACDVFVMPSRKLPADGLNVVVVEAMSCGKPVVATNVGGNELVVVNGENGFLHDENNHGQLAEKVLALLHDEELIVQMGKKARALVEEKFNWDAIAGYYLKQYELRKRR